MVEDRDIWDSLVLWVVTYRFPSSSSWCFQHVKALYHLAPTSRLYGIQRQPKLWDQGGHRWKRQSCPLNLWHQSSASAFKKTSIWRTFLFSLNSVQLFTYKCVSHPPLTLQKQTGLWISASPLLPHPVCLRGGPEVARGDAGKWLVIFNLHTAVTKTPPGWALMSSCAWGPVWRPGAWEDFSLSWG